MNRNKIKDSAQQLSGKVGYHFSRLKDGSRTRL